MTIGQSEGWGLMMCGGCWVQIDDRSPLVKYYQTSFFMYQPPSYPGITQRMVRCSRLMICPSEPFTFCISPFTYYWDTASLYGFTTQMVWVAIVTAELYLCPSKALLCFFFFFFKLLEVLSQWNAAKVDNLKVFLFKNSNTKAKRGKKVFSLTYPLWNWMDGKSLRVPLS